MVRYIMYLSRKYNHENIFFFPCSTQCKRTMNFRSEFCQNEDCVILRSDYLASGASSYVDTFDVSVDLADHTGTLKWCRIGETLAENMLGHKLDMFRALSIQERGEIKWKWLLERCTLKLVVKRKSAIRSHAIVSIVDCVVSKESDVLNHIKMY